MIEKKKIQIIKDWRAEEESKVGGIRFKEISTVIKFKNDKDYKENRPYQTIVDVHESRINCMLNAGITEIWDLIIGASALHLDNSNAQIGVGSNAGPAWQASTAYSLGDVVEPTTPDGNVYECTTAGTSGATEPTWVTGEGNTTTDNTVVWTCHTKTANASQDNLIGNDTSWSVMDATYPIVSNQKVTFQGDFGSAEANHAWGECSVRYSTAGAVFNRVVADKGTKTSGETWVAKLEITGA